MDDPNTPDIALDIALGRAPELAEIAPGADLGRDLVMTERPGGIDLAMVSGAAALSQSLALALTTLEGSDIFNTAFGFDGLNAMVEESDPVMVRDRARISVVRVLGKEPRVRRILDVKLGDDRLERVVAPGRVLNVRVLFEVATGRQLRLGFGGADMRA